MRNEDGKLVGKRVTIRKLVKNIIKNTPFYSKLIFKNRIKYLVSFVSIRSHNSLQFSPAASGNEDAKRLFEDLLVGYNRVIRPVQNNSDRLMVKMRLRLSQLIDVDEKNQIMTVNVWVRQEWRDYKLAWDPARYGGVRHLFVPADKIWLPDIVLYNK